MTTRGGHRLSDFIDFESLVLVDWKPEDGPLDMVTAVQLTAIQPWAMEPGET